jgi:amino acid adenylation domain-containing protein
MTVLHYLEKTAAVYPDKTAIEDEYGVFTFAELRTKALSIAGYISKELSCKRHVPILVYLPKGKECIATFLGIVYSGNIYTPTDVRFPFPKVKGIIDRLMPSLIITDEKNAEKLRNNGISGEMMLIYDRMVQYCGIFDVSKTLDAIIDIDPVYIFFTSGSTGIPKGVIITHQNIVDYIEWAVPACFIDNTTVMGNQSPFYFDISTQDIYACLKTAATLVIIPERFFSFPHKALEFIRDKKINYLYWVPTAFILICSRGALKEVDVTCVKQIIFGGEVMPVKHLRIWQENIPGLKAMNVYGPTEATVNITAYHVDREFGDDEILPLGWPCGNTELLVLDEDNHIITTSDISGELCARGVCLSPGYWNDHEKTDEVFVQNPLNQHYQERIYRTGDMVHYNGKEELVFDGRKDFQIKHLGYRIELAEIERAVMGISGISATVADYDKKAQQIVLFYVASNLTENDLQKSLISVIPKYMVPSIYYKLDNLPVNDNGKIDRKLLKSHYIKEAKVLALNISEANL